MKYLVATVAYGAEVDPTIDSLKTHFHEGITECTFSFERVTSGPGMYKILVERKSGELDARLHAKMQEHASAFISGLNAGYLMCLKEFSK